jgi:hypothetical protein
MSVDFILSYEGGEADRNRIDFYDAALALLGFQRSLAITAHMIINGEIITQAPSLSGTQIYIRPIEEGSWKVVASLLGGLFIASQAQQNSVLGNLMTSAYDYVIHESLGFHVDFTKTLGQQYEELHKTHREIKPQPQSKFDSVIEKCDVAISGMHRPLVFSKTATSANILSKDNYERPTALGVILTPTTYEYILFTKEIDVPVEFIGRVSSYNMNTYKGRIFTREEWRPIPFALSEDARDSGAISLITHSLAVNAISRTAPEGNLGFRAFRNVSRTGRLKLYRIVEINSLHAEYGGELDPERDEDAWDQVDRDNTR